MGLLDDDYAPSGDDGEQSGGESSDYEGDASDGEGDMSVSEEDEPDYRNVVVSGALHQYDPDEVPGDGDCFFASMHALGHGADIAALRGLASANGGAANIRTAGVWAGIPDITGVANGLNIRVRVIALALDGVTVTQDSTYGIGGPITVIAHIFGGHFTPLRPAPELLAAKMRSR